MALLSAERVKEKLQKALEATHVIVDHKYSDMCGSRFNVVVVSSKFEGKSVIQQQRMVNGALAEEMPRMHALTQKTYTPEAWKKINS